jgi:hypothetical protein
MNEPTCQYCHKIIKNGNSCYECYWPEMHKLFNPEIGSTVATDSTSVVSVAPIKSGSMRESGESTLDAGTNESDSTMVSRQDLPDSN